MKILPNPISWAQHHRIQRAVSLIEANFASRVSREEMARAAGLSISHFSKLFTQCMGISPHQYLLRCRLRHGKKLMLTLEQGLSIAEVACESGFADQAHFSRHFRRAYSVSPLAFRRSGGPEKVQTFNTARASSFNPTCQIR